MCLSKKLKFVIHFFPELINWRTNICYEFNFFFNEMQIRRMAVWLAGWLTDNDSTL